MGISGRALVRRWGGRAVGLTITGIGLYLVVPGLLTMFGAWPQLAAVEVLWFFVLAVLQFGRMAALWWLSKMAIEPARGDRAELARIDPAVPRLGWGT
jgi:hypothetical protein